MSKNTSNKIPVSVSLNSSLDGEGLPLLPVHNKRRLLTISALAIAIAIAISLIAKLLIHLIDLITQISFYGNFSVEDVSPADNHLGLWVIAVPAIGGLIVGLMALYGSKAIRGHGIPEAMEQILTNESKIKPTITYLKPVSSAISIGTGGPFGAEGPIIATGGALGSTLGQLLKISDNERKILLAAGATAGMSAIFGSPIAAIFLAIELLLFEFSPRSILPVALACITGAAGHHFLFGTHPVFEITSAIAPPENIAILTYSGIGILIGLLSVLVTKVVYLIEDGFEKLPIHWAWWPAIGGIVVGIVGYFSPRTLGVGYNNISDILTGNLSMQFVVSLCIFKFISWSVALGSGTSGGTLAPLLTIGGALGAIVGVLILQLFPQSGITLPLAALTGMAAMFAGSSRAFITSIVFALETTGQFNALLPLLAACSAAYIVSFLLMENTIMTEKISRRGVRTPTSYEADLLEQTPVETVMITDNLIFSDTFTTGQLKEWQQEQGRPLPDYCIIATSGGEFKGILKTADIYTRTYQPETTLGAIILPKCIPLKEGSFLRTAAEIMADENVEAIPVLSKNSDHITGLLTYRSILSSYKAAIKAHSKNLPHISLKRRSLKVLLHSQKFIKIIKPKEH